MNVTHLRAMNPRLDNNKLVLDVWQNIHVSCDIGVKIVSCKFTFVRTSTEHGILGDCNICGTCRHSLGVLVNDGYTPCTSPSGKKSNIHKLITVCRPCNDIITVLELIMRGLFTTLSPALLLRGLELEAAIGIANNDGLYSRATLSLIKTDVFSRDHTGRLLMIKHVLIARNLADIWRDFFVIYFVAN